MTCRRQPRRSRAAARRQVDDLRRTGRPSPVPRRCRAQSLTPGEKRSPRSRSAARRTPYRGDQLVEVRTRDFCSDSVGADELPRRLRVGYTYFREGEWKAGNRRSIRRPPTSERRGEADHAYDGRGVLAGGLVTAIVLAGATARETTGTSATPQPARPASAGDGRPRPDQVPPPRGPEKREAATRPRPNGCYRRLRRRDGPDERQPAGALLQAAHGPDVPRRPSRHGRRRPPPRGGLGDGAAAGRADLPARAHRVRRRVARGPGAEPARGRSWFSPTIEQSDQGASLVPAATWWPWPTLDSRALSSAGTAARHPRQVGCPRRGGPVRHRRPRRSRVRAGDLPAQARLAGHQHDRDLWWRQYPGVAQVREAGERECREQVRQPPGRPSASPTAGSGPPVSSGGPASDSGTAGRPTGGRAGVTGQWPPSPPTAPRSTWPPSSGRRRRGSAPNVAGTGEHVRPSPRGNRGHEGRTPRRPPSTGPCGSRS